MDEPVVNIRENNRSILQLNRRIHRDEINDIRRSVPSCSNTSQNVEEIANRLKTKASISAKELNGLKNLLMDDTRNIEVVLSVHGALRGLVRELTGNDVKKQCASAGCICNLATGDSKACLTIAKAVGSYLVTATDSLATELAVTCVWALGNLAASSVKVCEILTVQGAFNKMLEPHSNGELQEAWLYVLMHYAYRMGDELETDKLHKVLQFIGNLPLTTESSQTLFILSCHSAFPDIIYEELVLKLLEGLVKHMEKYIKCRTQCELVYIVRTLANTNESVFRYILEYLTSNNLSGLCKEVLKVNNDMVNTSMWWLFGNIFKCWEGMEFFSLLVS